MTGVAIRYSLLEKDQTPLLELPGGLMCPGNMALDTVSETEDFPDECDFMHKTKIIHLKTNVAKSP